MWLQLQPFRIPLIIWRIRASTKICLLFVNVQFSLVWCLTISQVRHPEVRLGSCAAICSSSSLGEVSCILASIVVDFDWFLKTQGYSPYLWYSFYRHASLSWANGMRWERPLDRFLINVLTQAKKMRRQTFRKELQEPTMKMQGRASIWKRGTFASRVGQVSVLDMITMEPGRRVMNHVVICF